MTILGSTSEISFFNSEDSLASASAADKSLQTSRHSSSERPKGSPTPRQLTRGVLLKPHPLSQSEKPNDNNALVSKGFSKKVEKIMCELLGGFTHDWLQFTPCAVDGSYRYQAKAEADEAVRKILSFCIKEGLHPADSKGGSNGYGVLKPFLKSANSKVVALTLASEHGAGQMPNITVYSAKGLCETLGPKVQGLFDDALLSRADVKQDFSSAGLFEELFAVARRFSKRKKTLKFNKRYSHVDAEEIGYEGRSFALGTRGGTHFMRVYEKDLERLAKKEIKPDEVDKNLVRLEFELRPQSSGKKDFARMEPKEMLLTCLWVREFLQEVAVALYKIGGNFKLKPRKVVREYKEKTLSKTIEHGVKQYGKAFADKSIETIVDQKFAGDYAKAKIEYSEVRQRAIELFARELDESGIIKTRMKNKHVLNALTPDQYEDQIISEMVSTAANKSAKRKAALANMAALQKAVAANFLSTGAYSICKARARQIIKAKKHEAFAFRQTIKKIRDCQKAA